MEVLKPCWAVATSGVPIREQLFNVSICHHSPFNFLHYGGDYSRHFAQARDTSTLEIATPILIPRDDGHKHRKGSHGDVIFLTNRGEVLFSFLYMPIQSLNFFNFEFRLIIAHHCSVSGDIIHAWCARPRRSLAMAASDRSHMVESPVSIGFNWIRDGGPNPETILVAHSW